MNLDTHIALAEAHPHDFTVQYPPRREYFMDCFRVEGNGEHSLALLRSLDQVLLNVHVPFCSAKCFYCNFAVDTRTTPPFRKVPGTAPPAPAPLRSKSCLAPLSDL